MSNDEEFIDALNRSIREYNFLIKEYTKQVKSLQEKIKRYKNLRNYSYKTRKIIMYPSSISESE